MPMSFQDLQAASNTAVNFMTLAGLLESSGLTAEGQVSKSIAVSILASVASQLAGAPTEGGPQDSDGEGMLPEEEDAILQMFSTAFDLSGAAQFAGEKDSFLANLVSALKAHVEGRDQPPSIEDLRGILDQAMVLYSDSDGDGQANLPLMSDDVVEAFWQSLVDQGLLGRVG